MIIAIDVDDIIRDTTTRIIYTYWRHYITDKTTTPYPDKNSFDSFNFTQWCPLPPNISKEHFFKKHAIEIFQMAEPITDAIDSINTLYNAGRTIYIITNQLPGLEAITSKWLETYEIPYHALIFTKDKNIVDYDILIDDNPWNLHGARVRGKHVLCIHQPWNRDWCSDHTGCGAQTWAELMKLIEARIKNETKNSSS